MTQDIEQVIRHLPGAGDRPDSICELKASVHSDTLTGPVALTNPGAVRIIITDPPSKAAALGVVSWAKGPGVADVALLPDWAGVSAAAS